MQARIQIQRIFWRRGDVFWMWPLRCPHHIITTLLQRLLKDNVAKQITLFLIFFHVDHHCLSKELAVNVILRQGSLFLIRHLAMSLHYKLLFCCWHFKLNFKSWSQLVCFTKTKEQRMKMYLDLEQNAFRQWSTVAWCLHFDPYTFPCLALLHQNHRQAVYISCILHTKMMKSWNSSGLLIAWLESSLN